MSWLASGDYWNSIPHVHIPAITSLTQPNNHIEDIIKIHRKMKEAKERESYLRIGVAVASSKSLRRAHSGL